MSDTSLDAEQFARLREAFHRLLDLDLGARALALAALAAEQPQLAGELNTLFDRLDESDLLPASAPAPPERLGPFRVGALLGRGGMGEVYLGERVEGGFVQQVALKLVRGVALAPDLARRFVRERQILARLQHPHIARLIDGGMTAEGRPWLAMDYVDGESITAWCSRRQLALAARVGLFLPVCAAVQSAHGSVVVHRDIKPGNVLVDAEGGVHLLDFGIARLLDDEAAATATAAMTPAFAAPEQRSGSEITTATDIYQLGVLLRHVLEGASQRVPATLRRIVERATAEQPVQRYPSAAALADDLADWLARRPLRSGIDGSRERLRLFLRQWRWPLLSLGLVILAIAGGGLLAWREARIAYANEQVARANLQALLGVVAAANPGRYAGREPLVGELLVEVAAHLQAEFSSDPHLLQQALGEIGHGLLNLGRSREAAPVLQAALRALQSDPEVSAGTEIGLLKLLVLAQDDASALPETRRSASRLLALGGDPQRRAAALDALASAAAALARLGDLPAAQQLFVDADRLAGEGVVGLDGAAAENYWRQRGLVALRAAQSEAARTAFERSRHWQDVAPSAFGALRRAELDLFLAEACLSAGDVAGARSAIRRASGVWLAEYPAGHAERGYFDLLLARLHLLAGDNAGALQSAQSAAELLGDAGDKGELARWALLVARARMGPCDPAMRQTVASTPGFATSPRGSLDHRWLRAAFQAACRTRD